MKTLKFKTTLKCNHCVATVKPLLDQAEGIRDWSVDLAVPERILSVEAEDQVEPASIIQLFKNAGYRAELLEG